MNTIICWDTETTGLPEWGLPSDHPDQPHIVQFACIVADADTGKQLAAIDLIVKPDGWVIPDECAAIHGITTAHASAVGIPEKDVMSLFLALGLGRTHVAHNSSFDQRIMRIALKRYFGDAAAEEFKARKFECTQLLSTPILKLPPTAKMRAAGRNHFKSANLAEAYKHFTSRELQNAHSAMADVQGCMEVYFAIKGVPAAAGAQP